MKSNENPTTSELTPPTAEETKKYQEQLDAEIKEFVAEILKAEEIMIPCRSVVSPQYNIVRLEQLSDSRIISVRELFKYLNIPEEKLEEIYQEGQFTENGKQMLADLIGKKINFYQAPEQYMIDPKTKETFEPQSNKDKSK